ncbi:MAG: hypothetical protein WD883_02510 [Candidatus Colwellbacteria bacterium]
MTTVAIDRDWLVGVRVKTYDWLQAHGDREAIEGAIRHLVLPMTAAPASLAAGYELGVMLKEMAYEYVNGGDHSGGDHAEQRKKAQYVRWVILHECLLPEALGFVSSREHAASMASS